MKPEFKVLKSFVEDIQATGGLIAYPDGTYGCAADPDWIDLADDAIAAQAVLEANGIQVILTIEQEVRPTE